MKRIALLLIVALALIALPAVAQTPTVNFAWDPNPPADQVTKYTLYERVGTAYNKLADIQPSACTATECAYTLAGVTPGVHYYVLTAANTWGESGYSNEVATPGAATVPTNVRITITITIGP